MLLDHLYFTAVISPMQKRLPLFGAAIKISLYAVVPNSGPMPPKRPPAPDLAPVVLMPASHIISAIPLEPSSRIIRMYPAFFSPDRQGLAGVNFKKIQRRIAPRRAELGVFIPSAGELPPAIGHILPPKHPKLQHFFRRQFGPKAAIKIPARFFSQVIAVILLHFIINNNFLFHWLTATRRDKTKLYKF
jgi:hypothetical protein